MEIEKMWTGIETFSSVVNPEKAQVTPMTIFGVVIDSTSPFRLSQFTDSVFNDFKSNIKLIDDSFNPASPEPHLGVQPFIHLFTYSTSAIDSPKVRSIGDIVLLKNAKVLLLQTTN